MLLLFALLGSLGMAQRPSDASICDYYAQARYGENSSTTQFQLIEGIVALAFGGHNATSNASSSLTGIFNPGTFQETAVDLHSYFNGSIDSTNLNNQPVGINWLDDGGLDPLYSYLNGSASSIVLDNSTNQGRLFMHFYASFAQQFSCSNPPPSPPSTTGQSGPIDLAYVHKFMNLNQTDLGYFIDQVTLTVQYFGFSDEDAQTLNRSMNTVFNVRCSPPDQNGQLQSLCLASSCPLAVPNPDCAAYADLTPNGVASEVSSGATVTPTPFVPSSVTPSTYPTSVSSPTPSSAPAPSSSSSLAPGAIAGISIGAAAVALLALLTFLFWRYKSKKHRQNTNTPAPGAAGDRGYGDDAKPPMQHPHQDYVGSYFYQHSTPSAPYVSPTTSPPPPSVMVNEPLYEVEGEGRREMRGSQW